MTECKIDAKVPLRVNRKAVTQIYTTVDMYGHFCTLELVWYTASPSLTDAHPRKVQRHHPMDIYKSRHWLSSVSGTLPICSPA